MNLFQKIFGTGKREKAAPSGWFSNNTINPYNIPAFNIGWRNAIYPTIDTEKNFKSAFAENAIFFGVVDRIAEKFGHIPRYVYLPEQQTRKQFKRKALGENVADGELMQLLLAPNEMQGQDEFFYLCAVSYLTAGECFIWKNRGGIEGGKPVELWVIPPWVIAPVSDGTMFGVSHYQWIGFNDNKRIEKEDVIHWKKPPLALDMQGTHLRGFNPMIPQRKLLTQADSITDASVSMFQQGGAKGLLYNPSLTNVTDEQWDKIDGVVDKKINSYDKKGSVAAIQGEWGYLNIGLNAVDMGLVEADDSVMKKICFVLGFPPELYVMETAFNNKEQAWHFFITNTMMPLTSRFDAALTKGLVKDFGIRGAYVAADYSDLPEMQVMNVKLVDAAAKAYWKTIDEKRAMTMDEPFEQPWSKVPLVPSGLVPADEVSIGEPMPNENNGDY
ncbi:MAG TPA: phage portal protein [Flavisolibacter sp.]|nr:phage portal protein [Flavisolibacter sp.]